MSLHYVIPYLREVKNALITSNINNLLNNEVLSNHMEEFTIVLTEKVVKGIYFKNNYENLMRFS